MFERPREVRAITDAPSKASSNAGSESTYTDRRWNMLSTPIAAASLGVELRPVESGAGPLRNRDNSRAGGPQNKSRSSSQDSCGPVAGSQKAVRIGGTFEVSVEDEVAVSVAGLRFRSRGLHRRSRMRWTIRSSWAMARPQTCQWLDQPGCRRYCGHIATGRLSASGVSQQVGGLFEGVLHAVQDWSDVRALIGIPDISSSTVGTWQPLEHRRPICTTFEGPIGLVDGVQKRTAVVKKRPWLRRESQY